MNGRHEYALTVVKKDFGLFRIRMKGPNNDQGLVRTLDRMDPQDPVGITVLASNQPLYFLRRGIP
jgi:hypothetical protein